MDTSHESVSLHVPTSITIDANGYKLEGSEITLDQMLDMILSTALNLTLTVINSVPEEEKQSATSQLYGLVEQMFADVLHVIDPTRSHSITDETLDRAVAAQDAFVMAALEEMKTLNPSLYKKRMRKVKQMIAWQKKQAEKSIAQRESEATLQAKITPLYPNPATAGEDDGNTPEA